MDSRLVPIWNMDDALFEAQMLNREFDWLPDEHPEPCEPDLALPFARNH